MSPPCEPDRIPAAPAADIEDLGFWRKPIGNFDQKGCRFGTTRTLGGVAVILIIQNRRLLIGTAVPKQVRDKVLKVLDENPTVEAIYDFKSRMLSVDRYRVKMEVEFDGSAIARKLEPLIRKAYPQLESYEHFSTFCQSFADQVIDTLGEEVDAIEAKIRAQVPGIEHIDIETD